MALGQVMEISREQHNRLDELAEEHGELETWLRGEVLHVRCEGGTFLFDVDGEAL